VGQGGRIGWVGSARGVESGVWGVWRLFGGQGLRANLWNGAVAELVCGWTSDSTWLGSAGRPIRPGWPSATQPPSQARRLAASQLAACRRERRGFPRCGPPRGNADPVVVVGALGLPHGGPAGRRRAARWRSSPRPASWRSEHPATSQRGAARSPAGAAPRTSDVHGGRQRCVRCGCASCWRAGGRARGRPAGESDLPATGQRVLCPRHPRCRRDPVQALGLDTLDNHEHAASECQFATGSLHNHLFGVPFLEP